MSPGSPAHPVSTARILALVAATGLVFGITAQLLRQIDGPLMALGGATAPWLTIGFVLAVWAVRGSTALRSGSGLGAATTAVYLFVWLFSYHATFAIRESVTPGAAWREAAPWLLVAGPACVVLGVAAAATHRSGLVGDVSLALPIAWSMPEITANLRLGWTYAVIVAFPTAALTLLPLVAVGRRDVRLAQVVVAWVLFGLVGLGLLPIVRSLHSFMAMDARTWGPASWL